jgi:4-hydroxy-2-oxoheptanedioate aldolase
MNPLEWEMVEVLADLRENHHVFSIKAEFESEGARVDEILRLKEIVLRAGLELTLTAGGCEALYDLHLIRLIGASRVVGPMIESSYALKKFLSSVRRVFPAGEREQINACIVVETANACHAFDQMLAVPEIDELSGIVMGRVDLLGSMGLGREAINSPTLLAMARDLFTKAKQRSLGCGIGGGVAAQALPFLRDVGPDLMDHYETSKVLFRCPDALGQGAARGLVKATRFELLWLKSKHNYYHGLAAEDENRLRVIESRYEAAMDAAGA